MKQKCSEAKIQSEPKNMETFLKYNLRAVLINKSLMSHSMSLPSALNGFIPNDRFYDKLESDVETSTQRLHPRVKMIPPG